MNLGPDTLMTLQQCAEYLHYSKASSALSWLRRHDVKRYRRGKCVLVRKSAIDAALERSAVGGLMDAAQEHIAMTPSLREL